MTSQKFSVSMALAILVLIAPTISYGAAVTNLNDSGPGSFRQAIIDSPDGDIDFEVTGTITLLTELPITTNLNITGPGHELLTISGGNTTRIFNIDDGDNSFDRNVVISGLTLTMGVAPEDQVGGAILNKESLLVENSKITNNSTGAIANDDGFLEVSKTEISANSNDFGGAGICTFAGNLTVTQSLFVDNTSTSDGGGLLVYNSGGMNKVINTTFNNNSALRGGAIAVVREFVPFDDENPAPTSLDLTNATIVGNHSTSENDFDLAAGGIAVIGDTSGISTEWKSVLNIRNTLVAQNTGFLPNCQNVNLTQAGADNPLTNIINDLGGNLSDQSTNNSLSTGTDTIIVDDFCNPFFNPQFKPDTMVIPLADNGGFTDTMELVNTPQASNPAIFGGSGCPEMIGDPVSRDQRGFPRPFLGECDIGAFEVRPKGIVAVQKETTPSGGAGFDFTGSGFTGLQCDLDGLFILGDSDSIVCTLPLGDYQITENPSATHELTDIDCQGAEIFETDDTSASITLQMDELVTCTFKNNEKYTLTVTKAGVGAGTVTSVPGGINCGVDCIGNFVANDVVTLTATPDGSSEFMGWTGDSDCTDGVVTMSEDTECTATFVPKFTLDITLDSDGSGNITSAPAGIDCGDGGTACSELFAEGTVVSLTATADPVSTFTGFTGDPDCEDGMVTIEADKSCTATFDFLPLLLSPIIPGMKSNVNTMTSSNSTPGGRVAFVWGFRPGSFTVGGSVCPGIELGISPLKVLGIINANGSGDANLAFFVPALGDTALAYTQAVDISTCRASDVVKNVLQSN